jgi:hypothetical protein
MVTGRFKRGDITVKSHSGPSSTCARPGTTSNFIQLRLSQFSPIFNKLEAHVLPQRVRKNPPVFRPSRPWPSGSNQKCSTRFPETLCQVGALELTGQFLEVLLDLILT